MSSTVPNRREPQHFVIGGGSGFIGSELTRVLRARGDRVTWISRTPGPDRITWDDIKLNGLPHCDGVVNLAGQQILNLSRRWNDDYRNEVVHNRTAMSYVKAIIGAEYILGCMPKGTHDWRKFITPNELDAQLSPLGFGLLETRGVTLNPLTMHWRVGDHTDTTYLQVHRRQSTEV